MSEPHPNTLHTNLKAHKITMDDILSLIDKSIAQIKSHNIHNEHTKSQTIKDLQSIDELTEQLNNPHNLYRDILSKNYFNTMKQQLDMIEYTCYIVDKYVSQLSSINNVEVMTKQKQLALQKIVTNFVVSFVEFRKLYEKNREINLFIR